MQSVRDVIRAPGQPLDAATRDFMESRFGRDFSAVRVHKDTRAAESARDVNAQAYALGRNVVFAAGKFAPRSHEGRQLIAHELAHVVQQSGLVGRVDSAAAAEGEARLVARRIAAGQSAKVRMSVSPTIQRAPTDEPLSLRSSYNPGAHTYNELLAEAGRIQHWLEKNPINSPDRTALEEKLKEIIQTANRLGARLGYLPLSIVDLRPVSKSPDQTQALDQVNKLSQPSGASPFLQPPQPRSSPPPQKPAIPDALPSYVVWGPLFLEGLKEGLRMDEKLQRGFETLKAQLNSSQGKMEFGGGMAVGIVPGALVAVADIPYSIFKLLVESGLQTNFGKMSKEEIDKAVENLVAGLKKLGARMPEVIGDIAAQPKEIGSWAAALISEKIREDLFLEEPAKSVEKKRESAPATNERPGKPSVTDILGIAPGVELPDLYKAARDKITQGKEGAKGGYVFNKGVAAGMALGYTLMNVVMLFIGPEEMAAKAGSLGAKGTEALAASRLWKRLGGIAESIPELKALVGAKRVAAEAKAGGTAAKGAEGLVESGGKAAARLAEERLPASVAKDVITKEEALIEVEFINKHPERVKGSPPRAELGGEGPTKHEIVQLPDGTCERHSKKMPVPCPATFKSTGTKSGEVKTTSEESPKLAPGMSTGEAAEAAALKPSRPNATLLGEKAGGYDATQGGRKTVNSVTHTKDKEGKAIVIHDVTIRGADAIQIKTITQIDKFGQPSKKSLPELVADNVTAAMKKAYNQPVTQARARTPLPGTNIYERTHVKAPRKITIIVQVPGPVTPEMGAAAAKVVATNTMAAELPPIEVIVQTIQ